MKHIYLLRHAKSEWEEPQFIDEKRVISPRGRKQIKALGGFLSDYQFEVDLALVSPAVRAEKTYQSLRKELWHLPEPEFRERIYEADAENLLFLCQAIPDNINSLLLVGHNPGLEEFASGLLFGNPEPSRFQKLPTSGFLGITFSGDEWKELAWGTGRLKVFWIPGQLGKE